MILEYMFRRLPIFQYGLNWLVSFFFSAFFGSAYGREVGATAVKFIPTGGLFVTGGLSSDNIDIIKHEDSAFLTAYRDRGLVKVILDRIPLFVVKKGADLGVKGVHKHALDIARTLSA